MISQYLGFDSDYIILGLAGFCIILFILVIVNMAQTSKMKKKYKKFMSGKNAKSLEETLVKKLNQIDSLVEANAANEKNIKNLNMILQEKENVLHKLNEKISLLSKKLEETEKELNLFSNINININNSNNASNSSGYVSSPLQQQQQNNHSSSKCCFNVVNGGLTDFKNTSSQIKLLNFKKLKPSMKHSGLPAVPITDSYSSSLSFKVAIVEYKVFMILSLSC